LPPRRSSDPPSPPSSAPSPRAPRQRGRRPPPSRSPAPSSSARPAPSSGRRRRRRRRRSTPRRTSTSTSPEARDMAITADGQVIVELVLDADRTVRGVRTANGEVLKLERGAGRAGGAFQTALGVTAANAITVLTRKLMQLAGVTLRTGADFEAAMARVGAVSRATAEQQEALTAAAREAGATTTFSATQAAEALSFLAMAGFRAEESIGALPSVLQLAASAQIHLGTPADITSNILTGYGMTVEELGRANDVLVASFTSANVDLSMLGESFKYVGPVARGAGVQFEEVAAAIGLLGNAGIQGSMAGTALR